MAFELNAIVGLISNTGFPIVAFWLMYKLATDTIRDNTEAIHELSEAIQNIK